MCVDASSDRRSFRQQTEKFMQANQTFNGDLHGFFTLRTLSSDNQMRTGMFVQTKRRDDFYEYFMLFLRHFYDRSDAMKLSRKKDISL
jgi:hypothetical protein